MADVRNKPRLFPDGTFGFDAPAPSAEETARRRSISTKCEQIKRCLRQNKRLTGKTLEFALTVVGEESEIGEKLKAGKTLTDYELHLVVDVWLLHRRLSSR